MTAESVGIWLTGADPHGGLVKACRTLLSCRQLAAPPLSETLAHAEQVETCRDSASRAAPNQVMVLGLLGTVVGLAGVVGSLQPAVLNIGQPGPGTAAQAEIQAILDRMGTTFACTAWGILLATTLAWMQAAVGSARSRYLGELELLLLSGLAPRLFPRSHTSGADDLREALNRAQVQISGQILQFEQALEGAGHRIQQHIQTFDGSIHQWGETARTQLQALEQSLTETAAGLAHHIAGLASEVRAADGAVERQVETLQQALAESYALMQNVERVCNAIALNYHEALQGVSGAIREGATSLGATTAGFSAAAQSLESQVGRSVVRLADRVETFELQAAAIPTAITDMVAAVKEQNRLLETWVEEQKELATGVRESRTQLVLQMRELNRVLEGIRGPGPGAPAPSARSSRQAAPRPRETPAPVEPAPAAPAEPYYAPPAPRQEQAYSAWQPVAAGPGRAEPAPEGLSAAPGPPAAAASRERPFWNEEAPSAASAPAAPAREVRVGYFRDVLEAPEPTSPRPAGAAPPAAPYRSAELDPLDEDEEDDEPRRPPRTANTRRPGRPAGAQDPSWWDRV
ncbi:MAG: hypothetical protein FJX77_15125, partial [Armatimonadetes bacterium]|nr:hypothetical protein [Armatimonadota bacterium]